VAEEGGCLGAVFIIMEEKEKRERDAG